MPDAVRPPFKPLPFEAPDVTVERRPDGSILIRSNLEPVEAPRTVARLLADRAAALAHRPFILQRAPGHGPWGGVTYGEAKRAADGVAQWLLERGLAGTDSVLVLSGNSVEHALLMLGCYTAGVPIAPISPAYSVLSSDHAKLKHCFALVKPRVVFAQSSEAFARALDTVRTMDPDLTIVTADGGAGTTPVSELIRTQPTAAVETARDSLHPATVAKFMFTSGSTGMPKAVPLAHRILSAIAASGQALQTGTLDLDDHQVFLEWMPWSHIIGGNLSFNNNLWKGGTLYLDEGKPLPGQFEATIRNLSEISPHTYGSAPVAFGMLATAMERDPVLRRSFFRNLRYMVYGGAMLSSDVYDRIQALAVAETGHRIPLTTMYGATETQVITMVHWISEGTGPIGLPVPGVTLKLVPNGSRLELRVKGPTVIDGYHNDPVKTAEAFDEEGFYKPGDACHFLDPGDPRKGLVFDGRVTEDFKLDSGTWVSVGTLRPELVAACSPYVFDMVIAGQDKPFVAAMIWPSPAALRELGNDPVGKLTQLLAERLGAFNRGAGGSSRRIGRFAIMTEPPSFDAGEIVDKGYVNQRATLERRRALVDALYADPPGAGVVELR